MVLIACLNEHPPVCVDERRSLVSLTSGQLKDQVEGGYVIYNATTDGITNNRIEAGNVW